jgi:beta-lactamase regulating signal transducer with metallopeptidase domain
MLLESMWTSLVAAVYALSAALVLILLLRVPIRQGFGARAAYALWSLVPASLLALCVPAPTLQRHWPTPVPMFDVPAMTVTAASATPVDPRGALVSAWIIGALVVLMAVGWRQHRLLRDLQAREVEGDDAWRSTRSDISPMVFGLWRTRIVLPADFEQRFDDDEQRLVRTHERMHLRGQDVRVNALAALLLALSWFNPLAWWSWRCFRFDQELACDALVIEHHPRKRRTYANAMLKAQLDRGVLPLGCHWSFNHPLARRIAMLTRKSPSDLTRMLGRATVALIALGFSYSIWAQKPAERGDVGNPPKKGDIAVVYAATIGEEMIRRSTILGADGKSSARLVLDGVVWDLDFDIQPKAPDRFRGTFNVKRNGELQGSPTMEWMRDATSAMRIADSSGEASFALEVRADILSEDAVVIDVDMREEIKGDVNPELAEAAKSVQVIRQADGSYRIDNLPKNLNPDDFNTLMEQVVPGMHETMQKNGDAPADGKATEAKAGVSPVSVKFQPAWQIDFMAQANPPDQC